MNKAIKDLKENAEYIKKILEKFGNFPVFPNLGIIADIVKKSNDDLAKFAKDYQDIQKTIQEQLSQVKLLLPSAAELNAFSAKIQEIVKAKKIQNEAMQDSGWWFTPSLMELPADEFINPFKKYKNGDTKAITNFFVSTYQKNKCQYLQYTANQWQKNHHFKPWQKQLNEAIKAHANKDYNLSVPVTLLVAEGIAKNYCKNKNIIIGRKNRSRGNKKMTLALDGARLSDSGISKELDILEIDLFFIAIDERIYKSTESITKSKSRGYRHFLNRHAILHGETKNYGTMKNSLQSFMLLDVLSLLK